MAREARLYAVIPGSRYAAIYEQFAAREEQAALDPDRRVVEASGLVYTGHESRLRDFRAGRPVRLPAWSVPERCRPGENTRALHWRRAVVWPDGRVQITDMNDDDFAQDWGHL